MAMACVLFIGGCGSRDEFRSYSVPKTRSRMIAAMLTVEDQTWFFKLTGQPEDVAAIQEPVNDFLKTVRPDDETSIAWDLPGGWVQHEASGMRSATIEVPVGGGHADLTVTRLPMTSGDATQWVLQNVNRWRGQLQLDPLTADQIDTETQTIETAAGKIVLVDIEGVDGPGGMSPPFANAPFANAPFAGVGADRGPATDPSASDSRDAPADSGRAKSKSRMIGPPLPGEVQPEPVTGAGDRTARLPFEFKTPDGWQADKNDSMSVVSFSMSDESSVARMTMTPLSAAAADLTANVNRWRGQIGMEPLSGEDIAAATTKLEANGHSVNYVRLINDADATDSESILGAIALVGPTAWFLKLKGGTKLIQREQQNFEAFVESLEFKGVGNGD